MSDTYIKSLENLIKFLEKKNTSIDDSFVFGESFSKLDKPIHETLNKIIENENAAHKIDTLNNHSQKDFVSRNLLIAQKQDLAKNKIIDMSSNKWNWNIVTGEVTFSTNWCKSLGYKVNEIKHHVNTWKNLVHPHDLPQTLALLDPHLKGETPLYISRNRLKMKNGSWRNNIDAGRVVERDAQSNPLKMEGVDIALE